MAGGVVGSAASPEMALRVKGDLNNLLSGSWAVELCSTPCRAPCRFGCGLFCPCCYAHHQRHKILDITGEPYLCCGGSCPCCREPCESREPWLTCEVCCCTSPAILTNRFHIQTRFGIQNDSCDNSIIEFLVFIRCLTGIAECCCDREIARHLEHIEHCVNATVCGCMLAQQGIELQRIEESLAQEPYQGPSQQIIILLPPQQQQMIQAAQALHMPAGAPPPMAPQAGLGVQGRQVLGQQLLVTVPPGVAPGQAVIFTGPNGVQSQATVPPGVGPGQQFPVVC